MSTRSDVAKGADATRHVSARRFGISGQADGSAVGGRYFGKKRGKNRQVSSATPCEWQSGAAPAGPRTGCSKHVLPSRVDDVDAHTFEPTAGPRRSAHWSIRADCVLSGLNDAKPSSHVTG